ncbi:Neuroligin-1 [Orchesella cincta]|uniref:Neuroligin-1 n=1 Tax=Orchesella cincta TaxID=48709 RepID=A0A1D2N7R8_ORCCI|nr:Neuroligin-1 [Orchesella cincta]
MLAVNENVAGRQTPANVNFQSEIPIENGRSATTGAGGGRNESFANFLNDARYGRFGVGSGGSGTSSSGWNFSPFTSRSRIVETKYGKVQGLSITLFPNIHYSGKNNPLKNKIVEIFLGIPYASPPIKSYRFAPTQTPAPWTEVRPTIHPSPACPQILPDIRNESAALKEMPKGYLEYLRRVEPYLRNQSEDCLYLNIFSPIGKIHYMTHH